MFPILNPPPSPFHPSWSSQCTSPKHPVSCIEPGLATCFIHDILHVSMPFSQICHIVYVRVKGKEELRSIEKCAPEFTHSNRCNLSKQQPWGCVLAAIFQNIHQTSFCKQWLQDFICIYTKMYLFNMKTWVNSSQLFSCWVYMNTDNWFSKHFKLVHVDSAT